MNKCNGCKYKSEKDIYNFQICIMCKHNPFVITDRFIAKEKVIVPEAVGELWRHDATNGFFHTDLSTDNGQLALIGYKGPSRDAEVTHGDHWSRIFPEVTKETP